MWTQLISYLPKISFFHLNILFILSLALFGGAFGARIFQKMKIPQVVGYIVMGLVLGRSGVGVISTPVVNALQPLNYFALGLIGFMIGGELKKDVMLRYGRQFLIILLFEGLISFALVTLLIGFVGMIFLDNASLAWSLAIMLGAISSATAPAATTDVLWEYKSKGPLTTTVFGIVALDDALALVLFAISSALATRILGVSEESLWVAVIHPLYEIGGALVMGSVCGYVLIKVIRRYADQKDRVLILLVGMLLFVLGLSVALNTSMILAAMVLGAVVVNGIPFLSKQVFDLLDNFAPPVYVLFFVFIGAKLDFLAVNFLLLVFIVLYLIGRTLGKMSGAFWGASLAKAHASVRKYLPLCLFSQAGVSIGLSIVAAHMLPNPLGDMIVVIITASTFVVQLLGPTSVKIAITKAGEVGRHVTEEDLMGLSVSELMDPAYPVVYENMTMKQIIQLFSASIYTQFPVVNASGHITGAINIDSIKQSLMHESVSHLLVGFDLKHEYKHSVLLTTSLKEAKSYMNRYRLGFLPVVDVEGQLRGCFDRRMYQKFVSTKLLESQMLEEEGL